jgi:hypothetical protein
MKNTKLKWGSIIALVCIMLVGCAGTMEWFKENKTPLEYGTKLAVIELITEGGIDPNKVIEVTNDLEGYISQNPSARAGDIVAFVSAEIPWEKLSPAQSILVKAILVGTHEKITRDLELGLLPEETYTSVREVIKWINEAALMTVIQ